MITYILFCKVSQSRSEWAFPKEWDFKKKLKLFLKNKTAAKSQATKLKKYLNENFTEENISNQIIKSVNDLTSEEEWDLSQFEGAKENV